MSKSMHARIPNRPRQSGAVLYVALIMLILLSLIGIVGLQVASLQERMSSNYQATATAFQRAERDVRVTENMVEDRLMAGVIPPTNIPSRDCTQTFDPTTWEGNAAHIRRMDECFSSGGVDMTSVPEEERTDQIFQITVFQRDQDAGKNPSSVAVISTVFIP